MICPKCGKRLLSTAQRCPHCGTVLTDQKDSASITSHVRSIDATKEACYSEVEILERQSRNTTQPNSLHKDFSDENNIQNADIHNNEALKDSRIAFVIVALIASVASVLIAFRVGQMHSSVETSSEDSGIHLDAPEDSDIALAVSIPLSAPNLDEYGSRIPVHVKTIPDGPTEDLYLSSDGSGIVLQDGSYEISVKASPIASDGTLYSIPDQPIRVEVSDGVSTSSEDDSGITELRLHPLNALDMDDETLAKARDAALEDPLLTQEDVERLTDAVLNKRASYDEAYIIQWEGCELSVPYEWRGAITSSEDEYGVSLTLDGAEFIWFQKEPIWWVGMLEPDRSLTLANGYQVDVYQSTLEDGATSIHVRDANSHSVDIIAMGDYGDPDNPYSYDAEETQRIRELMCALTGDGLDVDGYTLATDTMLSLAEYLTFV